MILLLLVLIVILIIVLLNIPCNIKPTNNKHPIQYLFSYWEFKKGTYNRPAYIDLCFDTMKINGKLFNVQILDDKTISNFLPDLRKDINELPLALKADYIRVCLLYNYGGIWLDADTIMITDMQKVVDLLDQGEDFIG